MPNPSLLQLHHVYPADDHPTLQPSSSQRHNQCRPRCRHGCPGRKVIEARSRGHRSRRSRPDGSLESWKDGWRSFVVHRAGECREQFRPSTSQRSDPPNTRLFCHLPQFQWGLHAENRGTTPAAVVTTSNTLTGAKKFFRNLFRRKGSVIPGVTEPSASALSSPSKNSLNLPTPSSPVKRNSPLLPDQTLSPFLSTDVILQS